VGTSNNFVGFAKTVSGTPENEIPSFMGAVERSTSSLDERISTLLDRLRPVLREASEDGKETNEQRAETVLGARLQDHRNHLDALYERVNDAITRLEV
jgi:hypothetical protein